MSGSFTHCHPSSSSSSPLPALLSSPFSPSIGVNEKQNENKSCENKKGHSVEDRKSEGLEFESLREQQVKQFMRTMARVSETIPILFVPGDRDVG